jgi:hypothetical protein
MLFLHVFLCHRMCVNLLLKLPEHVDLFLRDGARCLLLSELLRKPCEFLI